jgi:UDP-galactopyranose mutase
MCKLFDYIIVGAGFAGSVMAERIANVLNKKVLVIERRNHIGGNCYDYPDKHGILVHKYGPHIFHTELKHVWDYLSRFTDWYQYQHQVLGYINGKYIPIPFNLDSLHESFPFDIAQRIEDKLVRQYGIGSNVPILELKRSDDENLHLLADYVYNNVFLNYTQKQWGMKPEELDPSVTARVPISVSWDDHYFKDPYQGLPAQGYTKLFEKMLSSSNIKLKLNTDYKELLKFNNGKFQLEGDEFDGKLIFTGEIDYFFDYKWGKLPYRSLHFEMETINQDFFQEVATVNYPNDFEFTRITEFKHLTGQNHPKTTIAKEYPRDYYPKMGDIPYYPIPKEEFMECHRKYSQKADEFQNIIFLGRLAEYKYLNMDLVVDRALTIFKEKLLNGV